MILPAREISLVSTSTPEPLVYAWMMGRSAKVANAGASSIWVHVIFAAVMFSPYLVMVCRYNRARDYTKSQLNRKGGGTDSRSQPRCKA